MTEAICLAHDIGHCPFGHTGERVLNHLTDSFGGFEHNSQALRIVELLEHPYPDFAGLNLMYETVLGLVKHQTPYDNPEDMFFSEKNCSLEGQIADIADRIAYNCHDLEDAMRAGVIKTEQLKDLRIFKEAQKRINASTIKDFYIARTRTAKAIIDIFVTDCIEASKEAIAEANIKNVEDVYSADGNLIVLSEEKEYKLVELEKFLLENFYIHEMITDINNKVSTWLGSLFKGLCEKPTMMPTYFQRLAETEGLQRTVCDYIAGMTDNFCLKMIEKL